MTYISGTLVDSNAPSVLYPTIASALTSAGFTFVEAVVVSTRTHQIWKSPAASNPANKDWYLDVAYVTTGVGSFGFYVYEGYNATTHKAIRPVYGEASGTTVEQTYYTHSSNGANERTLESFSPGAGRAVPSYGVGHFDWTLPATSFGYWISITTTRVCALFSTNPTQVFYGGLYTPAPHMVAASPSLIYPLCMTVMQGQVANIMGGSGSYGSGSILLSRLPKLSSVYTSSSYYGWGSIARPAMDLIYANGPAFGTGSPNVQPATAGEVQIVTGPGPDNTTPPQPGWIGTLIDIMVIPATGMVRGDSISISGITEPFLLSTTSSSHAACFRQV